MKKAEAVDKKVVIAILSDAFTDNQSVSYVIRKDKKRLERISALMEYSFELCTMFGEVWLADDRTACALVLFPQSQRTTVKSVWLNIRLIIQAIGIAGIERTLRREAKIHQIRPNEEMAYLWFIGVNPAFQHKGIGSNLLLQVISRYREMNLPLYLETSTQKNIPWYESFGFEIYDHINLSYSLFFLMRSLDR